MKLEMSSVEAAYFESLLRLFSVVMVFDRELRIVFASETMHRHLPGIAEQPRLSEVFELVRPRYLRSYEEILARLDSLFLLRSLDEKFAIRGQVVHGTEHNRDYLVFCGSPWLNWMTANSPEIKLGLNDFSHQDSQVDQLVYMETENNMVKDLERLNDELKLAKEEVERAQAARNSLFAQMSHEMRTPLNGVVSALTLMSNEPLQGRAKELLDLAQKSSGNMLQVINYVLDIAKLESTDIDVTEVNFDLSALVESVIDIVRARAMEKQLDLRVINNASLASVYRGDAGTLRQVLVNLLINAIKFTDRGEITVDIDSGRSDGMSVRIEVADTGIGIPFEEQAIVFEPFATVAADPGGSLADGSGLGLDIAKRSIQAMGGDIGLISEPGVGSRFWIELPLEAAAEQLAPAEPDAQQQNVSFAGKVLLVDDNDTNLTLMAMILESLGVAVIQASSGQEALSRVASSNLDLVLMDISMPGMDGFEATRQIRLQHTAEQLPVVALTAYTGQAEKEKSITSGMNDFLNKPLEQDQLVAVLSRYLESMASHDDVPQEESGFADVDVAVVQHLQNQIGLANLVAVIDKFANEADRRWQAIEASSDSTELSREAHTLASTCGSFGLPGIAEELRAVEAMAKHGKVVVDIPELPGMGSRLHCQVAQLRQLVSGL